jgi:hypothetical protein
LDSTSFFKKTLEGLQLSTYFNALLSKGKFLYVTMPNGITYSLLPQHPFNP